MKIFVKSSMGKIITLEVIPSDTIQILKEKLQDKEGITQDNIWFRNLPLQDDQTLSECNIVAYSTVEVFSSFKKQMKISTKNLPVLRIRTAADVERRDSTDSKESSFSSLTTDDSFPMTSESEKETDDVKQKPRCTCKRKSEKKYLERKSIKRDVHVQLPDINWSEVRVPDIAKSSQSTSQQFSDVQEISLHEEAPVTVYQTPVSQKIPEIDWSSVLIPNFIERGNLVSQEYNTADLPLHEESYGDVNHTVSQIEPPKTRKLKKPGLERKQEHKLKSTIFLKDNLPKVESPNVLYLIEMELTQTPAVDVNMESCQQGAFGLLLNRKIPMVNSFCYFIKRGLMHVKIRLLDPSLYLSQEELNEAQSLHQRIFCNLLKQSSNVSFNPAASSMAFLVVPIVNNKINWSFDHHEKQQVMNAQFLPTSIYRISCLLLASEFRQKIITESSITVSEGKHSWPLLDLCDNDRQQRLIFNMPDVPRLPCEDLTTEENDIISFCREVDFESNPGPDPGLILQALTLRRSGDYINQERLEVIGDAFLEFAIILKLCVELQGENIYQMHKLKQEMVKNLTLYQYAEKKGLPSFLIARPFQKSTWTPPCFSSATSQTIKLCDKCIADTVQALIGAFLLACGQKGALMYMEWVGLDPLPKKQAEVNLEDFKKWPAYSILPNETLMKHLTIIERDFPMDFMKLSRLGNSIIEYIVTRVLLEDSRQLSPDEITKIRGEITNKKYLSLVAVKLKIHQETYSFQETSIKEEIDVLADSSIFEFFQSDGYISETIEYPDVEDVYKKLANYTRAHFAKIFMSNENKIDVVWEIYNPILKPALEHFESSMPVDIMKKLKQILNTSAPFSNVFLEENMWHATVTLPNGILIQRSARSKKICQINAAIKAVQALENSD